MVAVSTAATCVAPRASAHRGGSGGGATTTTPMQHKKRSVLQVKKGFSSPSSSSSSSSYSSSLSRRGVATAAQADGAAASPAEGEKKSSSSGDRPSIEERLAAALAEDTELPKNPNPLTLPTLPDLRELATIAALEVSDEEVADWTPKVHGILSWFGKLNDVDLDAVSKEVELYRDNWVMPLREDEPVDFANREAGWKWGWEIGDRKAFRPFTAAHARFRGRLHSLIHLARFDPLADAI